MPGARLVKLLGCRGRKKPWLERAQKLDNGEATEADAIGWLTGEDGFTEHSAKRITSIIFKE